jgi:hypothetical protein
MGNDVVLRYGERTIASGVFQKNTYWMYETGLRSSLWHHLTSTSKASYYARMVIHNWIVFFELETFTLAPLDIANGVLHRKDERLLLLGSFITLVRCMGQVWGASSHIYHHTCITLCPHGWNHLACLCV